MDGHRLHAYTGPPYNPAQSPTMKYARTTLPAALALLGAAWISAPQGEGPLKIAVVEVNKAIDAYPYAAELQDELKAMEQKENENNGRLRDQAEELEAELQTYDSATEKYARTEIEMRLARLRFEESVKVSQAKVQIEYEKAQIELERHFEEALDAFAKAKGYDVVLRIRTTESARNPRDFLSLSRQRDLLFHSARVDATDDLSLFMKTWKATPK